jgi:hypothetical protein
MAGRKNGRKEKRRKKGKNKIERDGKSILGKKA